MSERFQAALQYVAGNRQRFVQELIDFVKIASISTDSQAQAEMRRAAEFVAGQLQGMGFEHVAIHPTAGHPVIYADWLHAGPDKPTCLIYGHYDVQPAEPLELWLSPPFDPTIRGENLYGRGASDMKGQVMASLKAAEAWLTNGGLPLNVKFLIEGEEEIGSPNLDAFIAAQRTLLACDFAINPDTGMLGADIPTITYGLRGLAYFELRVSGPDHDLHSGIFGGVVHNPAQVLCDLIAGMHDAQGRVTLPGFYDRVLPLSEEERAELARLPIDDDFYLANTGASQLWGETGYTAAERTGARPTLEVNGLLSGFTGEGSKTVLPAKAMAKISMRLVPEQDPGKVQRSLLAYLEQHAPSTVKWELIAMAGGPASLSDRHMPAVQALKTALQETWGKPPVFRREGGSVPVVGQMKRILGVESVCTGFGLPDDNLHAPNEKIHLPTYARGVEAFTRFLGHLGEQA